MNALPKTTIQNNLISSAYVRYLRRRRLVESGNRDAVSPLLATADTAQGSAQQERPVAKKLPLPPAKPPMRLR